MRECVGQVVESARLHRGPIAAGYISPKSRPQAPFMIYLLIRLGLPVTHIEHHCMFAVVDHALRERKRKREREREREREGGRYACL